MLGGLLSMTNEDTTMMGRLELENKMGFDDSQGFDD